MSLPFYLLPLHEQMNLVNTQLFNIRLENKNLTEKEIKVESTPPNEVDLDDAMKTLRSLENNVEEYTKVLVRLSNIPYDVIVAGPAIEKRISNYAQMSELTRGTGNVSFLTTSMKQLIKNLSVFKVYLNISNISQLKSKYDLFLDAIQAYIRAFYHTPATNTLFRFKYQAQQEARVDREIHLNKQNFESIEPQLRDLITYAMNKNAN